MNPDVELIWLDLRDELKKFIQRKVNNPLATEDILQEVFVKVHLSIHQLKNPAKLTSWVYQITRNVIVDFYRQPQYNEQELVSLAEEEGNEHIYHGLSNCIAMKINALPIHDQEAVLLTYFKNYSQKELADFLGISYSGAKNRVQRAREKLRMSILDCDNVESDNRGTVTDFNLEN